MGDRKIKEDPLHVLSLFSGIGAFERALENLGIRYSLAGYSEIDKFASKSYSLLHNIPEDMNLGDITKINETQLPQNIDLVTYGFPCQDISIAGKKKGFVDSEGNKTRSGLFFDALRIIKFIKPKIAVAENVSNLTTQGMKPVFDLVLSSLQMCGYNNYWQVMNASDYGIPQSRRRVFIVSIRRDIDDGTFRFPTPIPLEKCMRDYLDDEVPESFYLSKEKTQHVIAHNIKHKGSIVDKDNICDALLARDYKDPKVVQISANLNRSKYRQDNIVYSPNGSSPTLQAERHGHAVMIEEVANLNYYGYDAMNRIVSPSGLCPTLTTVSGGAREVKVYDGRYRKLTPREYFKLMGFTDADVDLLESNGISKTQLYKMAGNSIVVNVLEHLFEALYQKTVDKGA